MAKYLIVNADDYGMCNAANEAVNELFLGGWLKSATIMMPCPAAADAVEFSKAHPEYAIGVHTTLTSEWGKYRWKPLTDGKTLIDEEGFMWHESDQVEKNASYEDIEKEVRAQIDLAHSMGMKPSHIDNHMGSLYGIETGRFELLNLTLDIAGEEGLPFRFPGTFVPEMFSNDTLAVKIDLDMISMFYDKILAYAKSKGVAMPDYLIPGEWNGPQNDSYENFKEYIYELYRSFPNGVTETYIHPALESDELKAISGAWHRRVWEHKLFSDPQTLQHIKACGIKLINYRDLAEMKK